MNYCINLKKRKNKPFCKIKNKEIDFSECYHCSSKEYKTVERKNSEIRSINNIKRKNTEICSKTKKLAQLERNRFSVFSTNTERCFLCGSTYNLTWHEIYAGRNRQTSMKYGFCLRLCLNCHENRQDNSQFNEFWHRKGQLYWESEIGTREAFIKEFGRNYLGNKKEEKDN